MNRELGVFLAVLSLFLGVVAVGQTTVAIRHKGCITLSLTPTPVGTPTGREELIYWAVDGNIYCGWDTQTLSATPASNTDHLKDGDGLTICTFPDKTLYCITDSDGAKVCYDEARNVTPTPNS